MLKILKLIVLLSVLGLGACASSIRTDVVSFHKLEKPKGQTFNIVPKEENTDSGLEFNSYASLVSTELRALGYNVSSSPDVDLVVKISYSVSDGKEKIKSYPASPFMGGRFYGNWGFGFGFANNIFWPGDYFSRSEIYAYTQYTRIFEMDIIQINSGEILFEGRVISPGKDKRLPEGMPYLVKALFSDFPGESGKTRKVTISTGNK
ncbi:MAG: DUF4136 domain-containing protein [Sphingomonadales bacterium]|jgi:hypothetical protein